MKLSNIKIVNLSIKEFAIFFIGATVLACICIFVSGCIAKGINELFLN